MKAGFFHPDTVRITEPNTASNAKAKMNSKNFTANPSVRWMLGQPAEGSGQ
jgi:hypothetical protein